MSRIMQLTDDPARALEIVSKHTGLILIDLDETLYLRNSTYEYIGEARPRIAAVMVLSVLNHLKPWRFTGQETADNWRVIVITLFFPWVLYFWRRSCVKNAKMYLNSSLRNVLPEDVRRTVIATLGFTGIVQPLIRELGLSEFKLISCRITGFADRRSGKLALVRNAIPQDILSEALLISDSMDDRAVFDQVSTPIYVKWKEARFRHPFRDVYYPLGYLKNVKRPDGGAIREIVTNDLLTWLLCSIALGSFDPARLVGVVCLFLSMWCIYELGYIENDRYAEKYESEPKLSRAYSYFDFDSVSLKPYIYSALFAIGGGLLVAHHSGSQALNVLLIRWGIFLVLLRALYRLYNATNKKTRTWLYLPLTICRYGAIALMIPMSSASVIVLSSMAVTKWFVYYCYRFYKGKDGFSFPQMDLRLLRMMVIGSFIVLFECGPGRSSMLSIYDAPLLFVHAVKALGDVRRVVSSFGRVA